MGHSKRSQVTQPKKVKDFAKKKKKVGKKLVQSNETTISIKTRKIVLPAQHDEKENELIFKGKSIADIITGTKHTNCNQRVNNLVNLHEMISNNLYFIESHAGSLMERLGVIIQDPEENVRAATLVLGKLILNHIKTGDLMPFSQIFIVQVTSGMLHIDKGVQKAAVQLLNVLLQNHLSLSMRHSETLISSLVTLMSTCRNKKNLLLYFQTISYVLKFYIRSYSPFSKSKVKQPAVSLYKYTTRCDRANKQDNTVNSELMNKLFQYTLPHAKTVWLEDAPSQVYMCTEPAVLKTSASIMDLLMLCRRSELPFNKKCLCELASIDKSVSGRFPLVCSVPNRDSGLLWQLNLKIAQYLVKIGMKDKVEAYFIACYKSRLEELTDAEMSQSLDVVSLIDKPLPTTMRVIEDICVSGGRHSPLCLSYFVRHWLYTLVDCRSDAITTSIELNIKSVAHSIIGTFYHNKQNIIPQIFELCIEGGVFGSLSEEDQLQCLEVYFSLPGEVYVDQLSDMGQAARTERVRDKFYSLLQALYHRERVSIVDYISILLTQANREDEDEKGLGSVELFTGRLTEKFSILPHEVQGQLADIVTPQLVERLYSGLSNFSLTSYLIMLSRLLSLRSDQSRTLDLLVDLDISRKLSKIISSLIFNKDSLSDWGQDIVTLAARISLQHCTVFSYISDNFDSKPVALLTWYFKTLLSLTNKSEAKFRDSVRGRLDEVYDFLKDKVSEMELADFQYRLSFIYGS